ncbi:OmpA family protein [Myroides odoratimimus]|uniref:OmpA family protein n=1 Tax=Myroides odoratimimus TaxID=76832 RepID=UPI0025776F44|nr:OmpA family protein [Myroides odoratimimus]MDM1449772.1 OmpA family protein [Myroides odoratimimus]
MKKKVIKFFSIASFFLITVGAVAQTSKEKKADKSFDYYEYVNAIEIYEKIINKGYKSVNTLTKLADAYYFKGELKTAHKWYEELFIFAEQEGHKLPSEYYYRYAQTLRSIEDYKKADEYVSRFAELEKSDSRGILFEEKKDTYLKEINAMIQRYDLKVLPINSVYSDYGSSILGDQLVFASARETEHGGRVHKWTNEAFTTLYSTVISKDGSFSEPEPLDKFGNAKVNVASAIFTKDGKTMYFTSNNFKKKKKVHNEDYYILLKLYKSILDEDGVWTEAVELPFNSDNFNTAHPALSPDERWLYFASDRSGTLGESDIYRVFIEEDGSYGTPENLGARINTEGRETFPFISKDNYLYFSSDGRPGLGGLDVYMAKLNVDNTFGKVVSVGAPINSSSDDFAFYINDKNKKGFISSNREGGVGSDDIYFFQVVDCKQQIEGQVYNTTTKMPIANAAVVLYDNAYKELATIITDANGNYKTEPLDCNYKFRLKASADTYLTAEVSTVLGREFNVSKNVNIGLDPIVEKIEKDDDLFKKLKLDPIYFDFDKATIRPDAAVELAKVVEVLNMYPKLKIDVRSHTDSRGNDAYNMKLSDRRAKSTVAWMVKQGIEEDRITGKGYGESQLVNKCANKVPCTIKEHQENRRSEFIILNIE